MLHQGIRNDRHRRSVLALTFGGGNAPNFFPVLSRPPGCHTRVVSTTWAKSDPTRTLTPGFWLEALILFEPSCLLATAARPPSLVEGMALLLSALLKAGILTTYHQAHVPGPSPDAFAAAQLKQA